MCIIQIICNLKLLTCIRLSLIQYIYVLDRKAVIVLYTEDQTIGIRSGSILKNALNNSDTSIKLTNTMQLNFWEFNESTHCKQKTDLVCRMYKKTNYIYNTYKEW